MRVLSILGRDIMVPTNLCQKCPELLLGHWKAVYFFSFSMRHYSQVVISQFPLIRVGFFRIFNMVWRSTEHVLSRLKICKFLLCLPEFHHFFRRRLILWFYGAITNLQICWRIFRVLPILRWELFPVLCVKKRPDLVLDHKTSVCFV